MSATLLLILAAGLPAMSAIASPFACPIPMAKGTEWTYEGTVAWTAVSSTTVTTNHICWTTRVIDSFTSKRGTAAVVHGMPTELARCEPPFSACYSVLLHTENRVYHIPAKTEKHARRLAGKLTRSPPKPARGAAEFLLLPLRVKARWGGDLDREDGWYCWRVESCQQSSLAIAQCSSERQYPVYTIAFRTCPEHELLDIVPEVGIVRYVYEHHGTTALTDVRLVAFRQGINSRCTPSSFDRPQG